MNRPFLRALAVRLGFSVHERSCHGPGRAWDWGPKGPMGSSHFNSEERAWADLEEEMKRRLEQAERMIRASEELIREDQS